MTKFNPENKETLSYGESLGPAMKITNKADAFQYKQDYIAFIQKNLDADSSDENMTAEEIANHNLAYYAGYYDSETRRRIESLFDCKHPVFGGIKDNGNPSPEKTFNSGFNYE